jgi:hypothetical protein
MSTQVGRRTRHDDLMTDPGRDLVIASGAAVRLRCLVGMYVLDVDVVDIVEVLHRTPRAVPSPS